MQPYFVPYAGYFRLFAAADVVVMFDCVQFPRRGRVHRNLVPDAGGTPKWLTLPLEKAPRKTLIGDLRFAADAPSRLEREIRRFPVLQRARERGDPLLERVVAPTMRDAAAYLCGLVGTAARELGFERTLLRSSALGIPRELRGQERVVEIARRLGATRYVNLSGGRGLYDRTRFTQAGIELRFLAPHGGSMVSILPRLLSEPAAALRQEILTETVLEA
jgi:hypothetical protein